MPISKVVLKYMKINKISKEGYLVILVGVFILFAIIFNLYNSENKKLENFSVVYSEYQESEGDSLISSALVPMTNGDFSDCTNDDLCGENTFYPFFQRALDFKTTSTSRVKNAKDAISFYENKDKEILDTFNKHNDELKQKSLKLIEVANSLKEGESKDLALKIAKESVSLQESYEEAYYAYSGIFSSRIAILDYLIKHDGTILNSDFNEFKEGALAIKSKYSEINNIYEKINESRKNIEENFSAFKGNTGVKEY